MPPAFENKNEETLRPVEAQSRPQWLMRETCTQPTGVEETQGCPTTLRRHDLTIAGTVLGCVCGQTVPQLPRWFLYWC